MAAVIPELQQRGLKRGRPTTEKTDYRNRPPTETIASRGRGAREADVPETKRYSLAASRFLNGFARHESDHAGFSHLGWILSSIGFRIHNANHRGL